MRWIEATAASACVLLVTATLAQAGQNPPEYEGPTAYLSIDDSPLGAPGLGVCVEDFEDGRFDIPGASGNATPIAPGGLTDSVDGDDGNIDGSGTQGRSYFTVNGVGGITITFDENRNEGLPRNVGLVWTDGGSGAVVVFEAFDKDDDTILKGPYGPFPHADLFNGGETAEDRYYGAFHPDGISKVTITVNGGGIEIDHIQLDRCFFCGDANFDSEITVTDALTALRTSVGSGTCLPCVCDTSGNGTTTSSDALTILRRSVGLNPVMACNECGVIV